MEALLRTYLPSGETLALLPSDLLPGQLDVGQIIARLSAPAHDLLPTIPLRLALHALRIAVAWRQVVQARGTEKDMGGLRGFVGYCVLGLGGSTLAQLLLSSPPTWLTNPLLLPVFALTYFCSAPVLSILLPWTPTLVLDVLFAGLDAINRTTSAMAVVALLASHPEPGLQSSWIAAVLLGGLACSGGGIVAGTLGLWDKDWSLQTPAILQPSPSLGAYALMTLDFWSGALVAAVYGTALDLPAFTPLRSFVLSTFGGPASSWSALAEAVGISKRAPASVVEAQVACTILLGTLLLTRVVVYWTAAWSKAVFSDVRPASTPVAAPKAINGDSASKSEKVSAWLVGSQAPPTPSGKANRRKGKGK